MQLLFWRGKGEEAMGDMPSSPACTLSSRAFEPAFSGSRILVSDAFVRHDGLLPFGERPRRGERTARLRSPSNELIGSPSRFNQFPE